MSGWVKIHNKALSNHIFDGDAQRFGAWVMLIGMAAWKPTMVNVNGKTIALKRGQLCASVRFLAKKFGVSTSWVQRYTTRLKTDTLIDTVTDTGVMIITICNYDIYQAFGNSTDTPTDTPTDTAAIHQPIQYIEEDLEEYKDIKINGVLDFDQPSAPPAKPSTEKKYVFAGKVIRLAQEDFDNWLGIYHAIPDLRAELDGLDDFYGRQPPAEIKNWFFRAKAALNKKHQAAVLVKREKSTTDPFSQFGAVDLKSVRQQQQERDRLDEQNRIALMAEGD